MIGARTISKTKGGEEMKGQAAVIKILTAMAVVLVGIACIVVYKQYFAPPPPAAMVEVFDAVRLAVLDSATRDPVPNATVKIEGLGSQVTDSSGSVTYQYVPAGDYNVTVTRDGYYTTKQRLSIRGTTRVFVGSINLRPAAVGSSISTSIWPTVVDSAENRTVGGTITLTLPPNKLLLNAKLTLKVIEGDLKVLAVRANGTTLTAQDNTWTFPIGTLASGKDGLTREISLQITVGSKGAPSGSYVVIQENIADVPDLPEDEAVVGDLLDSFTITVA